MGYVPWRFRLLQITQKPPSFQTEMDLSCTRTDQTVGPQNITESEVATNLVPLQPTLTYRECSISHGQGRTCDLYTYIYIHIYIYITLKWDDKKLHPNG